MTTKNPRAVLIYSGGLDSTTLLYWLRAKGFDVLGLGINYGQRHGKELSAAAALCASLGVSYKIADLTGIRQFLGGSSQTDPSIPVPEGHYAEESMKITVVPNRNMIMLSVALGYAISSKAETLAYGPHAGDHAIYPDCRQEFVEAMQHAAILTDWFRVDVIAPFLHKTKADLVTIGAELKVPFERTWSCYKGGALHCGKCGTCVERREAFDLAKIQDPTMYEGMEVGR